ncbi:MAG: SH3 domain-containing protein [Clostridia bacterium]|nr:SH3 domain-containing protein [Clostridia bacterium]
MKRKLCRATALALVLAMALGLMSLAGAGTLMYAKTDVNVRSGPGTNYAVLGYLDKGDSVTATGKVVGNWTQIQYSQYELGYVSTAYLTARTSSSSGSGVTGSSKLKVCSDCGDIYYATTALNVRSGPGTKYGIVGALAKGQQCTRVGKSGNWYKLLTTDGSVAYASASYLKLYATSTGDKADENLDTTGSACAYYYATTGLNVRKGPGTSYRVVAELNKGDKVTYLGKSGNWYKVRTARGVEGYCYKSYLSASAIKTAPTCYYCDECGKVVSYTNGCYTNGGVCYQDKYYCGPCYNFNWGCSTPSYSYCNTLTIGETYETRYSIVLYSYPSTSSAVTHTLLKGSDVTLISGTSNSSWVRVKVNDCGCYGYLPIDSIG